MSLHNMLYGVLLLSIRNDFLSAMLWDVGPSNTIWCDRGGVWVWNFSLQAIDMRGEGSYN